MLMSLVNPGVGETRAKASLPASRFSNDDLPTFERPMKANSGNDSSGHDSRSGALQSKMADEICTMVKLTPYCRSNSGSVIQQFSKFSTSGRGVNPLRVMPHSNEPSPSVVSEISPTMESTASGKHL